MKHLQRQQFPFKKKSIESKVFLKILSHVLTRRINYSRFHVTSNTIITRAYQSRSGSPDYQIFSHGQITKFSQLWGSARAWSFAIKRSWARAKISSPIFFKTVSVAKVSHQARYFARLTCLRRPIHPSDMERSLRMSSRRLA